MKSELLWVEGGLYVDTVEHTTFDIQVILPPGNLIHSGFVHTRMALPSIGSLPLDRLEVYEKGFEIYYCGRS
jgi:hypothetical protein